MVPRAKEGHGQTIQIGKQNSGYTQEETNSYKSDTRFQGFPGETKKDGLEGVKVAFGGRN